MTQLIIAAFLAGVACQLLTCVSSFSAFHTFICLSSYLYDTSVCDREQWCGGEEGMG